MSEGVPRIDPGRIPMLIADVITPADLAQLYPYLAAPLEKEGVLVTKASETRKGYDTSNWGYSWYLQRLNDVLGPAHWRIMDGVVHEAEVTLGQTRGWEIVVAITLEIGSYVNGEFQVIASRANYGTHVARQKGDALKGALTNGIKKTVAMLGPGWQAYAGQLDDDLYDENGEAVGYFKTLQLARQAAAEAVAAAKQRHAARGGKTDGQNPAPNPSGPTAPQQAPAQPQSEAEPAPAEAQQGAKQAAQPDGNAPSVEPFKASFTVASRPHRGISSQREPYAMVTARDAQGNTVRVVAKGDKRETLMGLKVGAVLEGEFKPLQGKNNAILYEWVA